MNRDTEPQTVGFGVFRPNQGDDEVIVEIEVPATEVSGKRRIFVALTPANFALALTGRGAIKGQMSVYEYTKLKAVKS